jgi:succinate---hydroxymethylglutarate CoA-transferase
VGTIRDVPTALEDARGDGRGMITTVQHPDAGALPMVGNPVKLASLGLSPTYCPPPRLGEHTVDILGRIGYTGPEIEALRARGAV